MKIKNMFRLVYVNWVDIWTRMPNKDWKTIFRSTGATFVYILYLRGLHIDIVNCIVLYFIQYIQGKLCMFLNIFF